ncbi:MAG: threonine/serine dehydratase [Alphaproteobacteria bacterium]|nr:threonine/serine dehydratase [Alphaproteobacteria bacterium]
MTSSLPTDPPTVADIRAAAARIAGVAVRTPLLEAPLLNDRIGARLLLKPECLQRTGSFKFRGAYNRISMIPAGDRGRGVVAYSSGNHAQGVAAAARMLNTPATIIMPSDAPAIKRANTEAWGATVVPYDRYSENREAIGAALAERTGATIVRPYDDPGIIAGQGTIGLEIAAQAAELDASLDAVLVCCGGGGLVSGTALALSDTAPGVPVWCVEPEGFDDTRRSLDSGTRQSNAADAHSICDALLAPTPGEITFPLNKRLLAGGLAVSDDEALAAMATAFEAFKVVLEPGGAVALAAALSGKLPIAGKTIAVVGSGGNVDPAVFRRALESAKGAE